MKLFKSNIQRMEKKKNVSGLVKALADKDWSVRRAAAEALGRVGDVRAVEPLIATLKDRSSYSGAALDMRRTAVEALGKIGDARAVELLIAALKDSDKFVCRAVAEALEKIGIPSDPTVQVWYALAKDDLARAVSLGNAAVEPLIAVLKDRDGIVRRGAAEALGRIGDARAVKPLCEALKDESEGVCQEAAGALGRIGDAGAVVSLCQALKNKYVRQEAAGALVKIGAQSVEPLCQALEDRDEAVRRGAAEVLGRIGDVRAVEPLCAALKDAALKNYFKDFRSDCIEVLVRIGTPDMEPLIAAFKDSLMSYEYSYCIEVLVRIGKPAVEFLIAVLKDKNGGVRMRAAGALGQIGDARAIEPLIAAFKSGDKYMQKCAVEALGEIELPADPAIQAWYAVGRKDWNQAISLGAVAVEPLLISIMFSQGKEDRDAITSDVEKALIKIGTPAVEPLCATLKELWQSCPEDPYFIKEESRGERASVPPTDIWVVHYTAKRVFDEIGPPTDPTVKAWYAVRKGDWACAISLGAPVVELLCAMVKKEGGGREGSERWKAAEALVTLYHGGKLDAAAKQKILALQAVMAQPHTDKWDLVYDSEEHVDTGIGVTL